ncbi:methyltransferase [Micromonospora auratinigra]|uniref:O-methyltransferase n=1 Tax=Micromonospora auratinigra TaxID=261654 RepID=A0A1A8ZFU2_9ACTN|nr:methyltransferase [Micromonospora auratinigra]SBT42747.1 O-methyltransferase [Micromonospora auratinigra]
MSKQTEQAPDLSIYTSLAEMIANFPKAQYARALALLRIPDLTVAGPRPLAELVGETGAHPESLRRFLRACVMLDLTVETAPEVFGMTRMGALLHSASPFAAIARGTAGLQHYVPYGYIVDTVLTGRPATKAALGMTFYEYLDANPDELRQFGALTSITSGDCGEAVAAAVDLSAYPTIVDVGGNSGTLLGQLLTAAPGNRGVLFDRPAIVPAAREQLAGAGLADRVEVVGGDFFDRVPDGGDLYTLKNILWDWDDADAARILATVAAAMPSGATLMIIDQFLPEMPLGDGAELDPRTRELHRVSFSILLQRGGRVRTEAEYRDLVTAAGLTVTEVLPAPGAKRRWDLLLARRP